MKCLIVDDEVMCREALRKMVLQVGTLSLVKACESPIDAIQTIQNYPVDLLFLDVEMPEMNGMELLRSLKKKPAVILTTSHKKYAPEAFDQNVVDYLVKPILLPRFLQAIEKARETMPHFKTPAAEDHLYVRDRSVLHKIPLKEILWIEAMGDYVVIHTPLRKFVLHHTLKVIAGKLPMEKFLRVHRSYIVSLENISQVDDTMIIIHNKHIPVGAIYKDEFIKRLNVL